MRERSWIAPLAALTMLFIGGCSTFVGQNSQKAVEVTLNRARFELECPDVRFSIVSEKPVSGLGAEGSEHTIDVQGCGRQAVYVASCRDDQDCNASKAGRIEKSQGEMP